MAKNSRGRILELGEWIDHHLLPNLDRAKVFADREPTDRGFYSLVQCPACGKRDAYVYKSGTVLKCNQLSSCAYSVSIMGYLNGGAPPADAEQFMTTIKKMSDLAGLELPKREFSPEEVERARLRESRYSALETVMSVAQRALWGKDHEDLRAKIKGLGFKDEEVHALGLGYYKSANEMVETLRLKGFADEDITKSKSVLADMEGYVSVPWTDAHGRPVTLHGVWLSPKLPAGQPRNRTIPLEGATAFPLCFNLAMRGGHKDLVMVQGAFDAFLLQARGDTRVVAAGSRSVSPQQARTMARHKVRSVTLCDFNNVDESGEALMTSVETLAERGITAYMLPGKGDGQTLDQFVRKEGIDAWKEHVKRQTVSASVFQGIKLLGSVTPSSGDQERQEAVDQILKYQASIRDDNVMLEREDLLRITAERTGYRFETLEKLARDHYVRRRFDRILRASEDMRADPETSTLDVARSLVDDLQALEVRASGPALFGVDRLEQLSRATPPAKKSHWNPLDSLGVRFEPGEFTVMAGRTSHGLTSVLVNLLLNWLDRADHEHRDEIFIYYGMDEPEIRLYHRMLSALSAKAGDGWTAGEIRDHLRGVSDYPADYQWPNAASLDSARDRLKQLQRRLMLVYRPQWTIDNIMAHARLLNEQVKLGGVLVDYLQLIPPTPGRAMDDRRQEISAVSRGLKNLAVETNTPIVAGASVPSDTVSREVRTRVGRAERYKDALNVIRSTRPDFNNLGEGGYQQEADMVLGLLNYAADYRHEAERAMEIPEKTLLEMGVLKSRYGVVGGWAPLFIVERFGYVTTSKGIGLTATQPQTPASAATAATSPGT